MKQSTKTLVMIGGAGLVIGAGAIIFYLNSSKANPSGNGGGDIVIIPPNGGDNGGVVPPSNPTGPNLTVTLIKTAGANTIPDGSNVKFYYQEYNVANAPWQVAQMSPTSEGYQCTVRTTGTSAYKIQFSVNDKLIFSKRCGACAPDASDVTNTISSQTSITRWFGGYQ